MQLSSLPEELLPNLVCLNMYFSVCNLIMFSIQVGDPNMSEAFWSWHAVKIKCSA